MHRGLKWWLDLFTFQHRRKLGTEVGLSLRGNFKLINQAWESKGKEMVATVNFAL